MAQLSPHFTDAELGVADASPQIVANAVQLCTLLLEPIRAQFGPIAVNDGYRPPAHNASVGGVSDSQHLYEGQNSAADIRPMAADMTVVFDWIRLQSHLRFDQVILEKTLAIEQPACIHISYDGGKDRQRRQALYGYTNGAGPYTPAVVLF